MLIAIALATLMAMTANRRDFGGKQQDSTTVSAPGIVQHELSEDDPPREPKHQESPAKKPRLKALLVQTTPVADPARSLAFHLRTGDAAPAVSLAPLRADTETGPRREDPVLRLHPGQAPPRAA